MITKMVVLAPSKMASDVLDLLVTPLEGVITTSQSQQSSNDVNSASMSAEKVWVKDLSGNVIRRERIKVELEDFGSLTDCARFEVVYNSSNLLHQVHLMKLQDILDDLVYVRVTEDGKERTVSEINIVERGVSSYVEETPYW